MSKVIGVACIAVIGLAAGVAYYFYIQELQKKKKPSSTTKASPTIPLSQKLSAIFAAIFRTEW